MSETPVTPIPERHVCTAGIDLGSTTTKAVILDDDGEILGRGITNSRSNFDAACTIARNEARISARGGLVRRALGADPDPDLAPERVLPSIERSFREARHRHDLDRLRNALLAEAGSSRHAEWHGPLQDAIDGILDDMQEEAAALFEPGAERRSDFFRDLAGAAYMRLSEERSDPEALPYDALLGVYDKAILLVENEVADFSFEAHAGRVLDRILAEAELPDAARTRAGEIVRDALKVELHEARTVGTGYGRARLPFPKEDIRSEILCHGLGAHSMFPRTRTVLDIGGQDTKAIQVDESGLVTGFQMNDRCAAGCGRYLGYIADEMNLGLHELGPLAQQARRKVRITSTCTVFAGAELRERLNLGEKREDILGGLHRAIILRAMSLLARSGGVEEEFTFTGGVARNPAAVDALVKLVEENYGERTLNVSADSIYTGALGAALFAHRSEKGLAVPEPDPEEAAA